MKKFIFLSFLSLLTLSAYADTCPPGTGGYEFSVAAWGDHVNTRGTVRCHYFMYNNPNDHKEIDTYQTYDVSAFQQRPGWDIDNNWLYALCTTKYGDENACQFGSPR